jgi:hypothetical protein
VLRWHLDDTRMSALARDKGVAVLAARRPSLRGALLAAKAGGHS